MNRKELYSRLRERLSGHEIGLIVLNHMLQAAMDAWRKGGAIAAFLTEKEVRLIQSYITTPKDIKAYNRLLNLLKALEYILHMERAYLWRGISYLNQASVYSIAARTPGLPKNQAEKYTELITAFARRAKDSIKVVRTAWQLFQEVGLYLSTPLEAILEEEITKELQPAIHQYNLVAGAGIRHIAMERIKASQPLLEEMRRWISYILGENWLMNALQRSQSPPPHHHQEANSEQKA